jgi:hypothetical protein
MDTIWLSHKARKAGESLSGEVSSASERADEIRRPKLRPDQYRIEDNVLSFFLRWSASMVRTVPVRDLITIDCVMALSPR